MIFHIFLKVKGITTFEHLKGIRYLEPEKNHVRGNRIFAVRTQNLKQKKKYKNPFEDQNKSEDKLPSIKENQSLENIKKGKSISFDSTPKIQTPSFTRETPIEFKPKEVIVENEKTYEAYKILQEKVILKSAPKTQKNFREKLPIFQNKKSIEEDKQNKKKIKSLSENKLSKEFKTKRISMSLCDFKLDENKTKTTMRASSLKDHTENVEIGMTKIFVNSNDKMNYQMKAKSKLQVRIKTDDIPTVKPMFGSVTPGVESFEEI